MASVISAGTTSGTSLNLTGDTSGQLQFQTNGTTTAVTIDTSQNVGIGTTSPSTKLDVAGTSRYTFNVSNAYTLQTSLNAAGSSFADDYKNAAQHIWQTSGTERMRIDSSGNVGIGNTPSGTYKLEVTGAIGDSIGNVRSVPLNSQTSAYVLAASDNGKMVSITTGGVTVNNSIMSAGMVVTIYNNSASSQTITQGTGVTLQWAGQSSSTTGNRTLGLYGICTIIFLSASSAVISGSGLT